NDHVCRGAEDEARVHVLHARERGVLEVDLDVAPALEAECPGALVGAAAEERRDGEDTPLSCAPARDALELAQLFQRVDPDVRVRADADPDPALADLFRGAEAVAEIRLGGRADADAATRLGQEAEPVRVRVAAVARAHA